MKKSSAAKKKPEAAGRVTRIDALTPEQEARMPEWRDKWIGIGLSTEPADRARFEAAVAKCYQAARLEAPKRIVWVASPLVLALAAPVASLILQLRKSKAVAVRGAVGDAVDGAVDGAVRGAVDVAVRGAVGGAVDVAVGVAVGDAVDGAVRDAVRGAVDGAVDGAPSAQLIRGAVFEVIRRGWSYYLGGQFWVGGWYWGSPSWVSFFREVCGLALGEEMDARAQAYAETAMSACWWYPHRDFVMVCERPKVLARDSRGRLHREDGPAAEFRDGWGVYSWHGVRMPADVIESPQTLTAARITAEKNAEVRRVMIERYGAGRYLLDSGAKEVHRDERGTLYRKDLLDDEPIVMVKVRNSTPEPDGSIKDYFLRVPPAMRTASEAVAWTFDQTAESYQPETET